MALARKKAVMKNPDPPVTEALTAVAQVPDLPAAIAATDPPVVAPSVEEIVAPAVKVAPAAKVPEVPEETAAKAAVPASAAADALLRALSISNWKN